MTSNAFTTFFYADGNAVEVGGIIKTGSVSSAVVLAIIRQNTDECEIYDCPDGGILIEEDWNGTSSLLVMTPPDREQWEDLTLVSRRT